MLSGQLGSWGFWTSFQWLQLAAFISSSLHSYDQEHQSSANISRLILKVFMKRFNDYWFFSCKSVQSWEVVWTRDLAQTQVHIYAVSQDTQGCKGIGHQSEHLDNSSSSSSTKTAFNASWDFLNELILAILSSAVVYWTDHQTDSGLGWVLGNRNPQLATA